MKTTYNGKYHHQPRPPQTSVSNKIPEHLLDSRRNNILARVLQSGLHQIQRLEQYRTERSREGARQKSLEDRVVLSTNNHLSI